MTRKAAKANTSTSLQKKSVTSKTKASVRTSGGDSGMQDRDIKFWGSGDDTESKIKVNETLVSGIPAVMACASLYADIIAMLPIRVYRRKLSANGRFYEREWLPNHPVETALSHAIDYNENYSVIMGNTSQPMPQTSSFLAKHTAQLHIGFRGNALFHIIRNNKKQTKYMLPVNPDKVVYNLDMRNNKSYTLPMDDKKAKGVEPVPPSEIVHIAHNAIDGFIGTNPVRQYRSTFEEMLGSAQYQVSFYRKGGRLQAAIESPNIIGRERKKKFREDWDAIHNASSSGMFGLAMLDGGMKWKDIQVAPDDAKFIQRYKLNRRDICGLYRTPPHLIGDMEFSGDTRAEEIMRQFLITSIGPMLIRWETEINLKCFTQDEQYTHFVEFDTDVLLRTDAKTTSERDRSDVESGIRLINEIRATRAYPPYTDVGDTPIIMGSQFTTLSDVEAGNTLRSAKVATDTTKQKKPKSSSQLAKEINSYIVGLEESKYQELLSSVNKLRGKSQKQGDLDRKQNEQVG